MKGVKTTGLVYSIKHTFITKVLRAGMGFTCTVLVTRQLGVFDKGEYSYILLVFGLIATYGSFGINHGMLYDLKRSNVNRENIINSNFTFMILIALILSILIILLWAFGLGVSKSVIIIIIGLCFIISSFFQEALNLIYTGENKVVLANRYFLITYIIKFLLTILMYLTNTISIETAFLLELINIVATVFLLYIKETIHFKFVIDWFLIKNEITFGFIVYLSSLFGFLLFKADQFIINYMLGAGAMGIYSTAASLCEMLRIIPQSITINMMASLYNQEPLSEPAKSIIALGIMISFYSTMLVSICCFAFLFIIPIIFGPEFSGVVPVMKILLIGLIFTAIGTVAYPYYLCAGYPKIHMYVTTFVCVINIIANLIAIPKFGIYGAAIASSISYLLYGGIYVFLLCYIEKIRISAMFIINPKVLLNESLRFFKI